MSDQHSPVVSQFMGGLARTPNLCSLADNGISFDSAYTSCPLCVPARMSFMSGRYPSHTGVFNNYSVLPDTIPTIAHAFDAAGYETVLIGRMHFVGENQKHGFNHRLVGDITSPEWKPSKNITEKIRGPFMSCFAEPGCTNIIGGGGSPVQQYDREVVEAAINWLSIEHDKPQFIVVGTYGPHFPYVAELEKYRYYLDKVSIPWGFDNPPDYLDPAIRVRVNRSTSDHEKVLHAQAAYMAMIETTDELIGSVRSAFWDYCSKTSSTGNFVYTSDHGDQCGERRLFGKMSFFENSVRIPLLIEGEGIDKAERRKDPVSLIDIIPTVCSLADITPPPCIDGYDILSKSYDSDNRSVISEVFGIMGAPGKFPELASMNSISRMVRKGKYKYITRAKFEEYDLLFDLDKDPDERVNIIGSHKEIASDMKSVLGDFPSNDEIEKKMDENWKIYDFMQLAEKPSQNLINNYWNNTSKENLELPKSI